MNKEIAIWNILHDGEITAVEAEHGDTLTMFVCIPYLRRRIPPLGDSFVLTLGGVTKVEFQDFDGKLTPLQEELNIGIPEILKTESERMPVTIETTMGNLILGFKSLRLRLDTGQMTDFETIERVCHEYWEEWERQAEQGHRA